MALPVVLVHGWGGSFELTWQQTGFTELLRDAGREVIGIDLLGHGTAPKPHEPEAYADLTTRIVDALPEGQVDAIGFSLGAMTLLRLATVQPERFRKLVLAGIGRNVIEPDEENAKKIIAAVEGTAPDSDTGALVFAQYARQPGNDAHALAAIMRRRRRDFTDAEFANVTCPTLIVIGDNDFAGPGEPLAEKLPNATVRTLKRTDHFATPESFAFIDAALAYIDAVPA
ncbi:MAG: putative hydrolase [Ilumatobacteraceae bacterium]|jgi:pimeloyl-ACP methyl ester carboxylesterase|nr:putative hydrolase [Ilumatobacteraceae bacterium]